MQESHNFNLVELYNKIEKLYLDGQYGEMLEFEKVFFQLNSEKNESEKLRRLAEMFSRAYIELDFTNTKLSLIKQFKTSLIYANLAGRDSDILNWKLSIEEGLFLRYVKVNKYILYLILLSVLLVNLDMIPSNNDFLPVLTGVAVVWYFLNIVMNCRVKRLYLNLIRFIYS